MTEHEIFDKLLPLLEETTGSPPEKIAMTSGLMQDLGAESLDLLDLSFLIEEAFGITLESDEFERQATERIPGGVYERDGVLTEEALVELRRALPEVPAEKLATGLRKMEVPSILTVGVFVHLIQRKLVEKNII
ncbi:MAG: phosphopantetheine-binding protein [Phycisphaerales bacterium]|nr:phosphopantetheine-binding protein [Phycisphaerales bacterium]